MKLVTRILLGLIGNLSFSYFSVAQTQVPVIEWQKTIGGDGWEYFSDIKPRPMGGYYVGGSSYSNISGNKTVSTNGSTDYWVVRLSSSGDIIWQKSIGGNSTEMLASIWATTDGGCVLGGSSISGISGDKSEDSWGYEDYWVVKLDSMGNIQWENTIGGEDQDFLSTLKQCPDGGYILGGSSKSGDNYGEKTEPNLGSFDFWIVKLGPSGNIQWQNTIGGSMMDYTFGTSSIDLTLDGGYIIGGASDSDVSGDKTENSYGQDDYWVVKLNGAGNIQWQNTIGGNSYDDFSSIQQTSDGGYILGGSSVSGISGDKTETTNDAGDYWIVKLNAVGQLLWQNTIKGSGFDGWPIIQETADAGYFLGGITESSISGDKTVPLYGTERDMWILKLDNAGNIQWQKELGGTDEDELCFLQQTNDLGYIVGANSLSGISYDKSEASYGARDYWVIKLCPVDIQLSFDDTSFCEDAQPMVLSASVDGGVYSGPGVINNVFYPSLAGVGTHLILYTNMSRCFLDTIFKTIIIHVLPNIIFPAIGTVCIDADPINLNMATPVGGTYEGAGIILNIFDAAIAGTGKHEITYAFADSNGCKDIDTNFIIVAAKPPLELGNDTSIWFCEGDQFELTSKTANNYKYQWNTGDTTFSILVEKEGIYSLTITDTTGCATSDSILISEGCKGVIFIPNTFSPNGDGLNDFFLPEGSNFTLKQIAIFNRWGEEIFKTTERTGSWNGTDDGQLCPEGVYVYAIDYSFFDVPKVHRKTGTITLLK